MTQGKPTKQKLPSRLLVVSLVSAALCAAGYSLTTELQAKERKELGVMTTPSPPIGYHVIQPQQVNIIDEMPGRTIAAYTAEVRPQVSGIVIHQLFEEGSVVEKGQSLYQIDPSEYEAVLAQAKASLKGAEAALIASKSQYERSQELIAKHSISKQSYDNAHAAYLGALANIDSAKAAIRHAQINLNYTTIKSPIAGRVGRSSITEGALVTANQPQPLAIVQSFNPIHVDLTSSTNELIAFRRALMQGRYRQHQKVDDVELILDDGSKYPEKGTFLFTDVNVSPTTSSYTLRVEFPNDDGFLLPGMFVRAKMPKGEMSDGLLVPAKALMRDTKGDAFVYIINNQDVAEVRPVQTGMLEGNQWLILDGLDVSDKVIVEGLQFVRPNMPLSNIFNADEEHASSEQLEGPQHG